MPKKYKFVPKQSDIHFCLPSKGDKPIPEVYSTIDTDLARDNLENDITAADLQDL